MNEITDKNNVLVLRGDIKIYINQQEFEGIKNAISRGDDMFEIQNKLVMKQSVLYIVSASEIREKEEEKDHIRRKDWKCSAGNWHSNEYKECSC